MCAARIPAPLAATILCLVLGSLSGSGCVNARERQNPWSGWTTLRLKAKSAPMMRGQVELRITDDARGRRLETTTTARFLGISIAESNTTTRFDPVTGRTTEHDSFSAKRGRRYRFHEQGYSVDKLRPAKERDAAEPWTVTSQKEFDWPPADGGQTQAPLHDYYGMLLHLARLELHAPGDEVTVYVATSGGPEAYRISVAERRNGERTFTDLRTNEKVTRPSEEFRLVVAPASPDAEEGFLNMEGDVEIWVEAETKTLLEIVGKVPKVPGKVKLVLSALG